MHENAMLLLVIFSMVNAIQYSCCLVFIVSNHCTHHLLHQPIGTCQNGGKSFKNNNAS